MTIDVSDERIAVSYAKHQSVREVGKELCISHETARYKLKKLGLLNAPIRYNWNDNFFAEDNEQSLYWAGFLAADGCIKLHYKKHKVLSVGLAQKDHDHLEKFKAALQFTGPVSKINGKIKKSELQIRSDKIFDDLVNRFNLTQRKSLTLTFPERLIGHPDVNHFLRGYFDGDGSFYTSLSKGRKIPQLYFSLRGTKQFLTVFRNILDLHCTTRKGKEPRLSSGIFALEYGGNKVLRSISDYLYANQTISMDRKIKLAYTTQLPTS